MSCSTELACQDTMVSWQARLTATSYNGKRWQSDRVVDKLRVKLWEVQAFSTASTTINFCKHSIRPNQRACFNILFDRILLVPVFLPAIIAVMCIGDWWLSPDPDQTHDSSKNAMPRNVSAVVSNVYSLWPVCKQQLLQRRWPWTKTLFLSPEMSLLPYFLNCRQRPCGTVRGIHNDNCAIANVPVSWSCMI